MMRTTLIGVAVAAFFSITVLAQGPTQNVAPQTGDPVIQGFPIQAAPNYTCSPTEPCALGCCGTAGFCGFGPTFCGAGNCTSGCDRKAECNPGWGMEWSSRDACPLNVCCSQYGFCGTTEEFCGDMVVTEPSCNPSGNTAKQHVIGYYEAWSQYRSCEQTFPMELPQGAWTHMDFSFVFIDPKNFSIVPMDERDVPLYSQFTGLKSRYSGLETWISVGGWSMNDPGPYNRTFSELAASEANQDAFADSIIAFMDQYGFDGVDIDWEYPVAEERAGSPEDFTNFVTWLRRLKDRLGSKYGLTITLPASYWYLQHFDIVNLVKYVDWFNVMTYDLHGTWDGPNPYVGPYVNSHTNLTEIAEALRLLWRNDIPPEKTALGLGFYGRSFTLANPSCDYEGCIWSQGGNGGPCTSNIGTLGFSEIKEIIDTGNSTIRYEPKAAVEEVTYPPQQWVSYDDVESFKAKYEWANSRCMAGLLVWAASLDDRNGTAQRALCESLGCTVSIAGDDASAPISCGTTSECKRYHTTISSDTCYSMYTDSSLTFAQLRDLNPQIDTGCGNIDVGLRYCVAGTPMPYDLAACAAAAASSSSMASTASVLLNPSSSPTEMSISSMEMAMTSMDDAMSMAMATSIPSSSYCVPGWITTVIATFPEEL